MPVLDREPGLGEASGPAAPTHVFQRQMTEAKKLIEKYRVPGGKQFLSPSLVGFDTANRDGIPLNGERCDALLGDIADMGWDMDEANFGNICVQERPGSREMFKYNRRACEASEFLAEVTGYSLLYGSLSHSHLHQCLKNIIAGAPAEAPTDFIVNGKLSLQAVALAQPSLAASARQGLEWEILSWKIRDEAGAMELIQSAWNRKAGIAMKESAVQAVARLSSICQSISSAGGEVSFGRAKQQMLVSMPELAGSSEFVGLMRFVVNVGADRATFIKNLKEFVGMRGKHRNIKPQVFALAGQLPPEVPFVITGMIMMALTAPKAYFVDGFSRFLCANDIRKLIDKESGHVNAETLSAEGMLRWFNKVCEEAEDNNNITHSNALDFMGKLSSVMCRKLTEKHMGHYQDTCPTLDHIGNTFMAEFCELTCQEASAFSYRICWQAQPKAAEGVVKSQPTKGEPVLMPKILTFADGKLNNKQDEARVETTTEQINWLAFQKPLNEDLAKARVIWGLDQLALAVCPYRHSERCCGASISVTRSSTGEMTVSATEGIPAGGVCLAPTVASGAFVVAKKKNHTYAPPAVCAKVGDVEMVILPSTRLPPRGIQVADWGPKKDTAFVSPFWVIETSPIAAKANCSHSLVSWKAVSTVVFEEDTFKLECKSLSASCEMNIPVITNHKALVTGDKLVLIAEAKDKQATKGKVFSWDKLKANR